uniref:Uncharacterized protein n=1 Tax=Oryza meyeriana var. granulata TaxID=110450 RepID=A0A1V1H997_9ORYZ|nr:hypothetical protein [Oryza meyeriana var. granulata]BAX25155.1 hypothetical protein [Oryza meyeriana var. granulata]
MEDSMQLFVDDAKAVLDVMKPEEAGPSSAAAANTLAMTKSLYPRVDIEVVGEGFADRMTPDQALALLNEVHGTAKTIAKDLPL